MLSGNEAGSDRRRQMALALIRQFNLPDEVAPETYLRHLLMRCWDKRSEVTLAAAEIMSVEDTHEWLGYIMNKLGISEKEIVREVFEYAGEFECFQEYIRPVVEWLKEKQETAKL